MKILFVDDEPRVLRGLQRMVRRLRRDWCVHFVESGAEALKILAEGGCDVIVSDVRMPVMDGIELLGRVKTEFPSIIRILLSGHSDEELLLNTIGPAHQFLSKPCTAEEVIETVQRAASLTNLLSNTELQCLVSKLTSLPSMPSLYDEMIQELNSNSPSPERLGEIISKDVAMSAKVMQLVHSKSSTPLEAVESIGSQAVRSLAARAFTAMQSTGRIQRAMSELWTHCMATGVLAREISGLEGETGQMTEHAFLAGFFHDIGRIVLVDNLPDEYERAEELALTEGVPLEEAERAVFGATHADVGGYLLGLWGLPNPVVEAVAYHHSPLLAGPLRAGPLLAVHVADALEHETHEDDPNVVRGLDQEYLRDLRLTDRVGAWRDITRKQPQ